MLEMFYPRRYEVSTYVIPFDYYHAQGMQGVIFDIDNTLVPHDAPADGQAVELFEASPEGYFDLIFMDVQMPVMNGYEATRRIRQLHRRDVQSIAIVAMTANAFVEDIRLSREAGMNEHVSKPVDFEHLQEIMKKYFSSTDRSEDAALSG